MYAQEEIRPYAGGEPKRAQVESMFDRIAHSYDRLNHLLSLGIDRWWRRTAMRYVRKHADVPPRRVLDVATGTGDFALLAERVLSPDSVVGVDISRGMMEIAERKVAEAGLSHKISFRCEDCSHLSFADHSFDAVVTAFGLRNFQDLDACLEEMRRVLRPGGLLVAIDLCAPRGFPMGALFWLYKHAAMPVAGRLISRDDSAYTYLPSTMEAVPQAEAMAAIFAKAGFAGVRWRRLVFGMCMLYAGTK